jgi:hypothetical protein
LQREINTLRCLVLAEKQVAAVPFLLKIFFPVEGFSMGTYLATVVVWSNPIKGTI